MSQKISVQPDENDLTLTVWKDGKRFVYINRIGDKIELEYLTARMRGFIESGEYQNVLTQEFNEV